MNHLYRTVRMGSYSQEVDRGIIMNIWSLLLLLIRVFCSGPVGGGNFSLILRGTC